MSFFLQMILSRIEERIPVLQEMEEKGMMLIEKSADHDCVVVEEELKDFHHYCKEVVSRLDRYYRRLLSVLVRRHCSFGIP